MKAILGTFVFSIETAIYHEFVRSASHRYASKNRLHQRPVRQSLGPGDETISLPGAIYPCVGGDPDSLDALRALMDSGQPQQFIDLEGNLMGRWSIDSVNETRTELMGNGQARKIEFDVALSRVD